MLDSIFNLENSVFLFLLRGESRHDKTLLQILHGLYGRTLEV
jgi:hypothetical protein